MRKFRNYSKCWVAGLAGVLPILLVCLAAISCRTLQGGSRVSDEDSTNQTVDLDEKWLAELLRHLNLADSTLTTMDVLVSTLNSNAALARPLAGALGQSLADVLNSLIQSVDLIDDRLAKPKVPTRVKNVVRDIPKSEIESERDALRKGRSALVSASRLLTQIASVESPSAELMAELSTAVSSAKSLLRPVIGKMNLWLTYSKEPLESGPSRPKVPQMQISLGSKHGCINKNGEVVCWGVGINLGVQAELAGASYIASGDDYTCGLAKDSIRCIASDGASAGALSLVANVPRVLERPTILATGSSHACASDGKTIACWGDNSGGQAPNQLIDLGAPIGDLAVLGKTSCAIVKGKGLKCWGDKAQAYEQNAPTLEGTKQVIASDDTICITTSSQANCFNADNSSVHTQVLAGDSWASASSANICFYSGGAVSCLKRPVPTESLSFPTTAAAGGLFDCAATSRGVSCWGGEQQGLNHVAPAIEAWSQGEKPNWNDVLDIPVRLSYFQVAGAMIRLYSSDNTHTEACGKTEKALREFFPNSYDFNCGTVFDGVEQKFKSVRKQPTSQASIWVKLKNYPFIVSERFRLPDNIVSSGEIGRTKYFEECMKELTKRREQYGNKFVGGTCNDANEPVAYSNQFGSGGVAYGTMTILLHESAAQ